MSSNGCFKARFVTRIRDSVLEYQNRARIHRGVRKGLLRPIGSKICTSNLKDDPARIVLRNVWQIAAELFPGALVSDRTAIENRPATDNSVGLSLGDYCLQREINSERS